MVYGLSRLIRLGKLLIIAVTKKLRCLVERALFQSLSLHRGLFRKRKLRHVQIKVKSHKEKSSELLVFETGYFDIFIRLLCYLAKIGNLLFYIRVENR